MTPEQFDKHIEDCKDRITETIQYKTKQYCRNDNPFHVFDRSAEMDGITPERALVGMMRKHEVSIRDIVGDIEKGKGVDLDMVAEKISDNINYLILLEGLIKRRLEDEQFMPPPNYRGLAMSFSCDSGETYTSIEDCCKDNIKASLSEKMWENKSTT